MEEKLKQKTIKGMLWQYLRKAKGQSINFICLFALTAIIYLFAYKTYRVPDFKIRFLVEYLLDMFIVCTLLSLLKGKWQKWITIILCAFAYIFGEIEIVCIENFHTTINPQIMQLVLETNIRESGEFLTTYLASFLNIKFLIVPFIAAFHICLSRRCLDFNRFKFIHRYFKYLYWGCFLIGLILFIKFSPFLFAQKKSQFLAFNSQSVGDMEAIIIRDTEHNDYNELMPQTLFRILYSIKTCHLMEQQVDKLYTVCSNVKVDKKSDGCPHIVLVIGESYNKHHSHLYGYHINTTPNQMRYYQNGNLVRFDDVVTPWDITSYAFKCFMTTWGVGDKDEWCDYPLITAIMKKVGYKVSFITNQFASTSNQGTICDLSGGFFLNDKRLARLQYDHRNERMYKYDGDLVDKSISMIKWGGKSDFTIFHLIGQHFDYSQRCPQNQKHITVNMLNRKDLSKESQKIMCDYDNSILYNDSVLSKIVDYYKNEDAVIVYMPDHSEGMFAPGISSKWGRSSFANIDYANAYENFQIPLWIYCTDLYIQKRRNTFDAIRKASRLPYMTDLMPYLVMHLAGVRYTGYDDSKDILSPHYNAQRKRLLRKDKDYNGLIQSIKNNGR